MIRRIVFFAAVAAGLTFVSCGIENYIYLEPVEHVYQLSVTNAQIDLPDNTIYPEFRNYVLFYRIYLSEINSTSINTDTLSAINPALASHYNTINPYTKSNSVSPSSIGTVFSNLKYHYISFFDGTASPPAEVSAYNLLDIADETLILDFSNAADEPTLTINSVSPTRTVTMIREGSLFTARPDRHFMNSTGTGNLTDASIINDTTNRDVEKKNTDIAAEIAYISIYIAATGINPNYSPVYSVPKFVGVFRLQ